METNVVVGVTMARMYVAEKWNVCIDGRRKAKLI